MRSMGGTSTTRAAGWGLTLKLGGVGDEPIDRRRIGERAATHDLLGGFALQNPLDRNLDDLPRDGPRHLGNLHDRVRNVARRAIGADPPSEILLELRVELQ